MNLFGNLISISLKDPVISDINISRQTFNSITLGYPCTDFYTCSPYRLDINPGKYRFECWGSRGNGITNNLAGIGGYTSGDIIINQSMTFYVYVGNPGYFNALKSCPKHYNEARPGGATDVRLIAKDEWYDNESLISRIMVAGGGGGTEWDETIGGNGGGIEGGSSYNPYNISGEKIICNGAGQTYGSECSNITVLHTDENDTTHTFTKTLMAIPGQFGYAIDPRCEVLPEADPGGMGGGGYYAGTTYEYAFGGSGGSSFISGHEGCDAVKNNSEIITHTGQSIHYSGIYFNNTRMISGNQSMPLPFSRSYGIIYDSGYFRLTILDLFSSSQQIIHINSLFMSTLIGNSK